MTTTELQRYLSGVLEAEVNIYIQKKTIQKLSDEYHSLAQRKKLYVPRKGESSIKMDDCMVNTGLIIAFLVGIVVFLGGMIFTDYFIIFRIILSVLAAIVNAVIYGFIGGIVLGAIVYFVRDAKEQEKLEAKLKEDIKVYDAKVNRENARMKREKAQQAALGREIRSLDERMTESIRYLRDLYAFDILHPDYRNIFAVSSILGYLKKGKTRSLEIDGPDRGAYNIYDEECRLNQIITNTEQIISRMDAAIKNQHDLAQCLSQATDKIDYLCNNVTGELNKISGSVKSIEQNQSIIAYNSECAAKELAFMNWMNTLY